MSGLFWALRIQRCTRLSCVLGIFGATGELVMGAGPWERVSCIVGAQMRDTNMSLFNHC